jgi:hypothetical protein
MKHLKLITHLAILLVVSLLCMEGHYAAAYFTGFVGFAANHSWKDYRPGVYSANTIDSDLQLTEVLGSAMEAIKRKLLPLLAFSTVFRNVQLKGDDTMAVPYYPLTATGTSQTRAATGSYKALVTGTVTDSRKIENFTNQVQALSFSSRERARQPQFDPVRHGKSKGEALAFDVLADIFSVVKHSNFTGSTLAAMAAANFDENDVGDLRQICAEEFWPDTGRSLILNPAFGTNLLKQPMIIDASKRGDSMSFRDGVIGNVLGFDILETGGLGTNNGTAVTLTGIEADDDIVTTDTAHGLSVGDRITFPTLTGGTGLTAVTGVYFVKTVPSTTTFTLSATLGGATLNITVDASAGTVKKTENIAGMAILPSAILIGFAPVPPTDGIRQKLVDYQELTDDSGLVLQYRRIAYDDTDEEVQAMEVHYGYALGDAAQLKLITVAP